MKSKRLFDFFFSLLVIIFLGWLFFLFYLVLCFDARANALFLQKRIGQFGRPFTIYKLQTIHPKTNRISKIAYFVRRYKIDELPQFFNVLLGQMSVVGPRPDVEGYYDLLQGENRKLLELKPGITSEASIKYKDEEALLNQQENPIVYNDTVIFPDKVRMNLEYYYNQSFWLDMKIILKTMDIF